MDVLDTLGDILGPYSVTIAKTASVITSLQFLSAIFLLNDVRKHPDTHPPDPFIGGCVLTLLSYKMGLLMNDAAMIRTNVFGIVVNIAFLLGYFILASSGKRQEMWSKLFKGLIFSAVCMMYPYFESPTKIEFRFGMIITTILVMLVGLPLLRLPEIIKNKSTEGLPFPMILSGSVVALSWGLYGVSIKNTFVTLQNLFLFALAAIQLCLFVIYPSSAAKTEKTKAASKKKKN